MTNPNQPSQSEVRGPVAVDAVEWKPWGEAQTRFAGRSRHLTKEWGDDYHVGVVIEELLPGQQSCPAHYHLHEEEHVWMLEGSLTLRLGDRTYQMNAGDYVCFPAGQRAGHCLVNHTDKPCRDLLIGERNPNEVAVYTDSNKVLVRALKEIYDKSATKRYLDGEDVDLD
jgi:uncharacterized cupin superfamily protein